MNMKYTVILLVGIILLILIYFLAKKGVTIITHPMARKIVKKQLNQQAKSFCLKDLEGTEICLEKFKGKNVLLVFWAPWCPHCINEMPELNRIHEIIPEEITVISVAVLSKREMIEKTVKKHNISYPVLIDSANKVLKKYKIRSLPINYIIDKEGIIKKVLVGEEMLTTENVCKILKNPENELIPEDYDSSEDSCSIK